MTSTQDEKVGSLKGNKKTSLMDSLFGNREDSSMAGNNEIFNKPVESFDRARKGRLLENCQKSKRLKGLDASSIPIERLTVEETINRRRRQSESSLLQEISCKPIYPANDEDWNEDQKSKETKYETNSLPIDVQVQETVDTFCSYGLILIRDAVPKSLLTSISDRADEIKQEVCNALTARGIAWENENKRIESFRFDEVSSRCSGRIDLRYETSKPPFSDTHIVENKSILPIINSLLGGGSTSAEKDELPNLVYAGLILSFPGSDDQPWHQDGMPLFPEVKNMNNLPPYALNVFFPLDDDDGSLLAGPTEFIPKSHRLTENQAMDILKGASEKQSCNNPGIDGKEYVVNPILTKGDALIYDYRVCHRGTSNLTHSAVNNENGKVRRILYLMYARPWFKEHLNFGKEKLFPAPC